MAIIKPSENTSNEKKISSKKKVQLSKPLINKFNQNLLADAFLHKRPVGGIEVRAKWKEQAKQRGQDETGAALPLQICEGS